jgi:hypothetical protein
VIEWLILVVALVLAILVLAWGMSKSAAAGDVQGGNYGDEWRCPVCGVGPNEPHRVLPSDDSIRDW